MKGKRIKNQILNIVFIGLLYVIVYFLKIKNYDNEIISELLEYG